MADCSRVRADETMTFRIANMRLINKLKGHCIDTVYTVSTLFHHAALLVGYERTCKYTQSRMPVKVYIYVAPLPFVLKISAIDHACITNIIIFGCKYVLGQGSADKW